MTKKHYEAIASILDYYGQDAPDTVTAIAIDMSEQFKQDNPKFQAERFLTACGIEKS